MTLDLSAYSLGSNQPLNRARILWNPATGTITGDGTDPELAANDFTFQRWTCGALPAEWVLEAPADFDLDTVVIAGHNLAGQTVEIETSPTTGGSFTLRATVNPTDNSTIAAMFNQANGSPRTIRRVKIRVSGAAADAQIGIIRAGVALQMQQPVFGGVKPLGLNRIVETRHSQSETGQWLGRVIQRQALQTEMSWTHLEAAWYRSTFHPFALALPQTPFALIQNPLRMPESVAWCWVEAAPQPENMGIRDFMQVSLAMTGLLE